ncbi:hypothetical protein Pst134EB_018770 [Puccinia striiformis f. sp. tritici]|nr:hypothetical protein Pst134EB_018770 [Puccinia striiformis f. sp. tritici]
MLQLLNLATRWRRGRNSPLTDFVISAETPLAHLVELRLTGHWRRESLRKCTRSCLMEPTSKFESLISIASGFDHVISFQNILHHYNQLSHLFQSDKLIEEILT